MKITIYSSPFCHWCTVAKNFLNEHKVAFEEVNVTEDPMRAQEAVLKSGQNGIPVIVIEKDGKEEVLVGFDEARLKTILEIKDDN